MQSLHVGIIMDGNRRFSKKLLQQPWKGHQQGANKLKEVLEWCKEEHVDELTVFALSLQNFSRPKKEFEYLMKLFRESLQELDSDELARQDIRIRFIGRTHLLPNDIQEEIQHITQQTEHNQSYTLSIAIAYGGREEITDGVQKIAEDIKNGVIDSQDIDEELINTYMQQPHEPDLIIRTGGDIRTSNFLVWQSSYSEWFFVDTLWPAFSKEGFIQCLDEFRKRERRFGK